VHLKFYSEDGLNATTIALDILIECERIRYCGNREQASFSSPLTKVPLSIPDLIIPKKQEKENAPLGNELPRSCCY
jgi:hypothetical protein